MIDLKLKAKALVAVRRKREKEAKEKARVAAEARESALIDRLLANLTLPIAKDGKDGRDAPTLSDIIAAIPVQEPNTVVQMVEHPTVSKDDLHKDMEVFIKGYLPTVLPEDRPAVEQITNVIDVSDEKISQATEGMVTKKEFNKALKRIQDAITASQSGGGGIRELTNVIEVAADTVITAQQLLANAINIILVTTAGITVTLPEPDATKIVWVQQGYTGTGTFTVCKA